MPKMTNWRFSSGKTLIPSGVVNGEKKTINVQLATVSSRERDLLEITKRKRKPAEIHKLDDICFFKFRCNYLCSVQMKMLIRKDWNSSLRKSKKVYSRKEMMNFRYDIMK